MFKKYILLISAMLSFGMIAQAEMSGDASGFMGSFELKYKADLSDEGSLGAFSYRARAGWAGEVNSMVNWKVALSSDIEQNFGSFGLNNISLEQAYVSYRPIDMFMIKVGKFGWNTMFNKTSVLYDDDLYAEGIMVKFKQNVNNFNVKVMLKLINIDGYTGPFTDAPLAVAAVGVKGNVSGVGVKAKVGVQHDGLLDNRGDTASAVTLLNGHLSLNVSELVGMSSGLFGNYGTNLSDAFGTQTYAGGAYVGGGNEMGDYMVAVSYYDIDASAWNADLVDTDYVSQGSNSNGVAAKVSYNCFDNSNIALKYNYNLAGGDDPHNLIAELTFNF